MTVLLEARGLRKSFPWGHGSRPWRQRPRLWAVDGVDLRVERGECLAVVGESGSGKTTLGRCLLRLLEPDAGEVFFDGEDLLALPPAQLQRRRTRLQMVFQDSAGALDPRMRVEALIAEPLKIHRSSSAAEVPARVRSLLASVGLAESLGGRYPHQLSGGQRQRVAVARALATDPRLLVLDEPVSALDVSVRAQILRLLEDLRRRLALTLILIAHDLAMVRQIADRVAVLYLGRVIEVGSSREVFGAPQHPYTASLLRSIPAPDPARRADLWALRGEIPSPLAPPSGCAFHPRCPISRRSDGEWRQSCREEAPDLAPAGSGRMVACHHPGESDAV